MANTITGTYRQGSSGDEVKEIQQMLIDAGYDVGKTGADGVFGKNTLAAVQKYQKDYGLSVDGIVGKNTLASLYKTKSGTGGSDSTSGNNNGASNSGNNDGDTTPSTGDTAPSTSSATPTTSPGGVTYGDFYYDPWNPQDNTLIQEANNLLQQHMNNKVGDWEDPYKDKWLGYMEQYENRDPFSYDFNSDALYNQYKDQYIQQGRMAMMDTMGQAQAMTGGYGNSYAQTVGQQAYNQQLNQLNDVMPELYGMAYDRYNQEGQDMLNKYSLYKGMSEQDYTMHQNDLNNWYTQLEYLTNNYNTAYDREYNDYLLGYNTKWNEYLTDREEKFTADQNAITREANEKASNKSDLIKLITSTGYEPTDEELDAAGMTKKQAEGYLKAYNTTGNTSYLKLEAGSEAYKIITTDISRAEDIDRVDELVEYYTGLGYDPDAISWIATMRKRELKGASGTGSSGSSSGGT